MSGLLSHLHGRSDLSLFDGVTAFFAPSIYMATDTILAPGVVFCGIKLRCRCFYSFRSETQLTIHVLQIYLLMRGSRFNSLSIGSPSPLCPHQGSWLSVKPFTLSNDRSIPVSNTAESLPRSRSDSLLNIWSDRSLVPRWPTNPSKKRSSTYRSATVWINESRSKPSRPTE